MQNDYSIATMMLDDGLHLASTNHDKSWTKLVNFIGHKIDGQIEYSIKQKLYNEKTSSAIGLGITGTIMIASTAGAVGIAAGTKGIATPVALAGLAAGTWAANQVGEAVTGVIKNQFRKKRMRNWLKDYPDARESIDGEAEQLQLTVSACDSVRRAIDHFQKAGRAAKELGQAILTIEFGRITHCSEVVGLLKKQMKFLHEVRKAELYLIPAIDLAIYLKHTQIAYIKAFDTMLERHQLVFGMIALKGDHRKCTSVCYRPVMAGVPKPTKRVQGSTGNGDNITAFCSRTKALEKDLDALTKLRQAFAEDLLDPAEFQGNVDSDAKQRFQVLVTDAARYYDSPGPLKRFRHYVGNSITRRTNGELVAEGIGRGLSLGVSVGTSVAGSSITSGLSPLISQGIVAGLQNTAFDGSLNLLVTSVDVSKTIGDATASLTKTAMTSTISAGAAVANLAVDGIRGKIEGQSLGNDGDVDSETLIKAGKSAADDFFKKAARHLKQAIEVLEEVKHETYFPSCTEAMMRSAKLGEFAHHMSKSDKHLTTAMAVVGYVAARIGYWNELEGKSFAGVRRASLGFLNKGCSQCACHQDKIPNLLQPCYGPSKNKAVPKRRIVRV
ncbi:MAG: hypothetical protein IV100_11805 [Myxococcales bacterium]|nr:hypothetical protein [Myxococcales bacterium]